MIGIVLNHPQPPDFIYNVCFFTQYRDLDESVATHSIIWWGLHIHHPPLQRKAVNFLINVLFKEFKVKIDKETKDLL
jgi:hypothetical protein